MKLIEYVNYTNFYDKLMKDNPTLPMKLYYKLNKINKIALEEKEFYKEELNKILQQYAEIDEQGNFKFDDSNTSIILKPNCSEECNEKIKELASLEVQGEIENYLLDINEIETNLSVQDANILIPFIK